MMESLNLNTLASSLPNAHQNAEKDLLNNFKAAALSITTLYRSSRHTSKRAYNAGYASACQDLLMMIQQGVSVGGIDPSGSGSSHDAEGGGMTIGRVMDWIEARLDAIKSREEEEDEDEEREKERERGRPPASTGAKPDNKLAKPSVPSASTTRPKDQTVSSLPTPRSPRSNPSPQLPSQPSSPSPPPSTTTLRPIHQPPQRSSKSRPNLRGDATDRSNPPETTFTFVSGGISSAPTPLIGFPDSPIPIAAGAKRRHTVMMMLDGASSPVSIGGPSPGGASHPLPIAGNNGYISGVNHATGAGGSRRRTRSSRGAHPQNQNLNLIQAPEAMDVEEDCGRERKRVARR